MTATRINKMSAFAASCIPYGFQPTLVNDVDNADDEEEDDDDDADSVCCVIRGIMRGSQQGL